jgi:hypothetical protein
MRSETAQAAALTEEAQAQALRCERWRKARRGLRIVT